MAQKTYDLAVVGAGPGGLMAAKTAAEAGLSVVVVEKRRDVSKITRACCEQFIMDENYSGDTLRIEPGRVVFTNNGFSVDYDGPLMNVTDKYYLSPRGRAIHFAHGDGRPIVVKFDKGKLLQGLWRQCERAGVAFMPETVAYGAADDAAAGVTLAVHTAGRRAIVAARKVIAADGANTGVAEALGFNKRRTCYAIALCLVYYLEGIGGFEPTALRTYFGRAYQGLAPIMIGPSIENPDVGYVICTGNSKYAPPRIFENVTRNGVLAPVFKNARVVKTTGCSIKTFSPLAVPWQGNALVVGDAAAYVEVETQGALMCGYRAGTAVARELAGQDGFDEYTRWWQRSFEFLGGDFMRVAQGFVLVPTYTDDELDYLFGLLEGEVLEGTYNQYRSPRIMWDAIARHGGRIQAERPEIYDKMTTRQVSLSDML